MGEQTEHLRSLVKKLGKVARYMSQPRWFDAYNLLMEFITHSCVASIPHLLKQRVKATTQRRGVSLCGGGDRGGQCRA